MPTRSESESISSGEVHSVLRTTLRQANYSFDAKGSTDKVPGLSQIMHHDMQRIPAVTRRGSRLDVFLFL
jgi:hypothetical protein